MTTEKEIADTVGSTRILWDETPESFLGPWQQEMRTQEDFERHLRTLNEAVGTGYFYVDVRDMGAELALFHSTHPGYWETLIIPERYSPLLEEDLVRCVEVAGGATNRSGHYPLDERSLEKVRGSYLGAT
jgi:hypothetical protein